MNSDNGNIISIIKDFVLERTSEYKSFSNTELKDLFYLAKEHNIGSLVANCILNSDVEISEYAKEKFVDEISKAMFLFQKYENTSNDLKKLFNENAVPFVFLKGSRLKDFYPQPYLRDRVDIDVLVKEEHYEKAKRLLSDSGCSFLDQTLYDVSFASNDNVRIELHYTLCYDEKFLINSEVLKNVWDNVYLVNESEFQLNDEYFVLYFLIHTAKHFYYGGSGLRSLIDFYYILNNVNFNQNQLVLLCEKSKIGVFYEQIKSLTLNIFNKEELKPDQKKVLNYIISGGVFGNRKNMLANSVNQFGSSKVKINRIFPRLKYMEVQYPKLKKYKILLPFYYVKRWCRVFDKNKRKSFLHSSKLLDELNEKDLEYSKEILSIVGLYGDKRDG